MILEDQMGFVFLTEAQQDLWSHSLWISRNLAFLCYFKVIGMELQGPLTAEAWTGLERESGHHLSPVGTFFTHLHIQ